MRGGRPCTSFPLPPVAAISLIFPCPHVPSSTRTVAPVLSWPSIGSCLTTTCAAHIPLAESKAANATDPVISFSWPLPSGAIARFRNEILLQFYTAYNCQNATLAWTLNIPSEQKPSFRG